MCDSQWLTHIKDFTWEIGLLRLQDLIARLQVLVIGDNDEKIRAVSSLSPASFIDGANNAMQVYRERKIDAVLVATSDIQDHQEVIWDILYYNPKENIFVMSFRDNDLHLMECLKLGLPYVRYSHRELEIILGQIAFKLKARSKVMLSPIEHFIKEHTGAKGDSSGGDSVVGTSASKSSGEGVCLFCNEAQEQIYQDEFQTPIHLTPKLKRLFWILYRNHNQVVSYDRLITHVYDGQYINYNTLRMAVVRLKKHCGELVQNISGEGYMLACHKTYLQDKILPDSGI